MCIDFYYLPAWCGCWSVDYMRRSFYKVLKCVSFWLHGCCGKWEGWACKTVNHTSWVAVVNPINRSQSAHYHRIIERFGDVFVLALCPFDIYVGKGAFCYRIESDLFLFLLILIQRQRNFLCKLCCLVWKWFNPGVTCLVQVVNIQLYVHGPISHGRLMTGTASVHSESGSRTPNAVLHSAILVWFPLPHGAEHCRTNAEL